MRHEFDSCNLTLEQWDLGVALNEAAEFERFDEVVDLVGRGADVNYPHTLSRMPSYQLAAMNRDWKLLEYLSKTGKCDWLQRSHGGYLTSTILKELYPASEESKHWSKVIRSYELAMGKREGIFPNDSGNEPWGDTKHMANNFFVEAANGEEDEALQRLADNPTVDVNYYSARECTTAAHEAAAQGLWRLLGAMLRRGDCDLLVLDGKGRRPSQRAYEDAQNKEWGDRLAAAENAQKAARDASPATVLEP